MPPRRRPAASPSTPASDAPDAAAVRDAADGGVTVRTGTPEVLEAMSPDAQGLVAVLAVASPALEDVVAARPRLVAVLAQVRDPGNAGTVIRCADAFGADAVILSTDSVEVYNPKTVRASVGSIFHLPVVTGVPLEQAIEACRAAGMQVFATDGDAGVDLTDLDAELSRPTAWVMGNEAWGLPSEHLALADGVLVDVHALISLTRLIFATRTTILFLVFVFFLVFFVFFFVIIFLL